MPSRVRVGASRPGAGGGGAATDDTPLDGAMSAYKNRPDSVGYNPRNPYAYLATQGAKQYGTTEKQDAKKK